MRTQTITGAIKIFVPVLAIVAANAHGATPAAGSAVDSRIAVTAVAGSVDVTMAGRPVAVHTDSTVLLPARIVTGHDGTLGVAQAGTSITVSNDTDVEIPAEAVDGNLVARLVQHRGNVFYDVAPRDLGKLRVETPFLVAVIKGTQFNVTVQADSTTISLFEGQLELLTPDGSDIVQLDAGEIAIRSLLDDAIRVVGMDDERVAAPPAPAARVADAADARPTPRAYAETRVAGANAGVAVKPTVAAAVERTARGEAIGAIVETKIDLRDGKTGVDVSAGSSVDVELDIGVDLDAASLDTRLDTGIGADLDLGGVVADLDASLDLGTTLDLGGVLELDVDLDAGATAETVDQTTAPELPRLLPPGVLGRP